MALTRVKASVLSLIPDVIFVTLFEFYRWETEPADPPDEPKYSAWAFCAVALTSMTICLEFWLNFQFGIRLVTFSGIELPDGLLIGWSLPLWLVACFLMYLKDNRGFVLVLKNREKSRSIRVCCLVLYCLVFLCSVPLRKSGEILFLGHRIHPCHRPCTVMDYRTGHF